MNLWTEYEGRTIDGAFPLTKLIRPEGRSAFFSTSNGTGVPTVIRLIESHFDGDEILARWRDVTALNHPNLVNLKKFGQVSVDETSLVYTVMEPAEGDLGEILRERRLTEPETRDVATSVLAAIEALHSNGFVHEHVEPANVLAVGEVIKLRSDCIREAPEGEDGCELKRRDVHDYAVMLLEALTQHRTLDDAKRDLPLPVPFEQVVRKGMSGEWGLAQIGVALKPAAVAEPIVRTAAVAPAIEEPVAARVVAPSSTAARIQVPVDGEPRGFGQRRIVYGVGALLLLLLGWYFVHGRSAGETDAAKETPVQAPVTPKSMQVAPKKSAAIGAGSNAAATTNAPVPALQTVVDSGRSQWRVIAFTYNHEDQAQQMVATIAKSHPDLNPTVFTPTGQAPFLVTLGGPMSREDAFAFSGKAKREGMPRDVYAQNYRRSGH